MGNKIILMFWITFLIIVTDTKKRLLVKLDRVHVCNKTENAALRLKSVSFINPPNENVCINAEMEIWRPVKDVPKLTAEIIRCLNKEALDTCVQFAKLKPLTTCGLLFMDNTAWEKLIKTVYPPLSCPFEAGNYTMINGTFDTALFSIFPLENFYWKVKFYFEEDPDFIAICVEASVLRNYT